MKNTFLLILVSFLSVQSFGQSVDPAAKKILERLKADYESHSSMEIDFDLVLDLPESPTETQSGKIVQSGEFYKVHLADQAIYCDGTGIYVHLIDNNEVQINDIDDGDDSEMMSPKDLLRVYESEAFEYAITGEAKEGGKVVKYIEFKPTDADSEYAKLKMTVLSKKPELKSMTIFGKDGSRYTIQVKSILFDKKYEKSIFEFDASKYPGIRVEDLRLD